MAAVSSHARVQREVERTVLLRKLSENRRALNSRTGHAFDELSHDGTWLTESQIEELLAISMRKRKGGRLQPDAIQLVVDTAHRSQEKERLTPPSNLGDKGAVAKAHIVRAVEMYGEYINNAKRIDDVFKKYDKGKDGYLSKKELMKLLADYELKQTRSKNGFVIRVVVTSEDIDWIIDQVDRDQNGMISQAEYLPAIAAWEEVAKLKLEGRSGCGCAIM